MYFDTWIMLFEVHWSIEVWQSSTMVFPPTCQNLWESWKAVRASSPLPVVPWPSPSTSEAGSSKRHPRDCPWSSTFGIPGIPVPDDRAASWECSDLSCLHAKIARYSKNCFSVTICYLVIAHSYSLMPYVDGKSLGHLDRWRTQIALLTGSSAEQFQDIPWHWATASDWNLKLSPLSRGCNEWEVVEQLLCSLNSKLEDVMVVQFLTPNAWVGLIFWIHLARRWKK